MPRGIWSQTGNFQSDGKKRSRGERKKQKRKNTASRRHNLPWQNEKPPPKKCRNSSETESRWGDCERFEPTDRRRHLSPGLNTPPSETRHLRRDRSDTPGRGRWAESLARGRLCGRGYTPPSLWLAVTIWVPSLSPGRLPGYWGPEPSCSAHCVRSAGHDTASPTSAPSPASSPAPYLEGFSTKGKKNIYMF